MNKNLIRLFAIISFCCCFNSCSYDDIIVDYANPEDPRSDSYVPVPPASLYAYGDEASFKLSWNDYSHSGYGFIIERSDSVADNFVEIGRTGPGVTAYTDIFDFKVNIYYYYRVRSFQGDKKSTPSNVVQKYLELKAPTGLYISSKSGDNIVLTWYSNSSFNSSFDVESRIPAEESTFKKIGSPVSKYTYFLAGSLERGKLYEFRVCAVSHNSRSAYTNVVTYSY